MSDEKLRELLGGALPDENEIAFRAARARRSALKRLDEPSPVRRWSLAPAWAVAVLVIVAAGILSRQPAPAPLAVGPAQAAPAKERSQMRMKWVLSDGTRVLWTFRRESNT